MRLSCCSSCDAFVPPTALACPHCAATQKPSPKARGPLRGLMAVGAGGLLSMTLSACYGVVADPYDSGPFPEIDAGRDSGLVVDSGPTIEDAGGSDDAGADGGASDGGASDGGASDGGADTDGGASDGGADTDGGADDDAGAGDDAGA